MMMNYRGLVVAAFYAFMSVASVFINKAIFSVYHFNEPFLLVLGQTIFTLVLLFFMRQLGVIRIGAFQVYVFRRVFLLSAAFLLKLLLDMSALALVNIPMYGVLKSTTTPFVLILDYIMRKKKASARVQLAVYLTCLGGLIAGVGDLTFDLAGYLLALSSAMATAAYVVIVGKLGEELQVDSFTLLLYNNCWSLPFSSLLVLVSGEYKSLATFPYLYDRRFLGCFIMSCASAFVLNLATYLCTLVNDSLTTSVVGRTKSILQGLGGLFAFGDVLVSATNLIGLLVNSIGIGWYAYEKYLEAKRKIGGYKHLPTSEKDTDGARHEQMILVRDSSQLLLSPQTVVKSRGDQDQNGRN